LVLLLAHGLGFHGSPGFRNLFRRLGGVAPSSLVQDRTERDGQFLNVGLKSRGRDLGPLPPRQTLQALW
jgi:hypothetical protein